MSDIDAATFLVVLDKLSGVRGTLEGDERDALDEIVLSYKRQESGSEVEPHILEATQVTDITSKGFVVVLENNEYITNIV
jgi:hypothetical protein